MPWRRIIGLRSLLAHGYWTIDVDDLRRQARCQSSSQIFARCSATTSEDLAPRLGKAIPNSCAEGGRRRGNMVPTNRTS
jgi:Protein of unknown function DUF86